MNISLFDLFTIGIGPSSSHTVGPMRAAREFATRLADRGLLDVTRRVEITLYGSLAATGKGHGTDRALVLGLMGETPEAVPVDEIEPRLRTVRQSGQLNLLGRRELPFELERDLRFEQRETLPRHPNALRFRAFDSEGTLRREAVCYSVGGGFIVWDDASGAPPTPGPEEPYPFNTATELLTHCRNHHLSVSEVMRANERSRRSEEAIRAGLARIWEVMQQCVQRGCQADGVLPGGLNVPRRAGALHRRLLALGETALRDPLTIIDWVDLYAFAVTEENAAGGRVVTAPTNGAAGILPAVLHYATRFCASPHPDGVDRFLLTAGAIGILYKRNASISGADVGCQGEVGVACSMAAGALAEYLGGTPAQVENAAEIGMEHNLGLTCDPIGGLVQIPCIERNAMASIKAINAARIALRGDGHHFVSLDKVIATMCATGHDMLSKYKETAQGGLAVNVVAC